MFFFCFCFFVFVFLVFFFCFLRREFVLYLFFFLESTRYRVPRIVIIRFYVRLFWEVSIYIVLIDDFIEWYTMWYRVVFVFFFYVGGGRIMSVFYFWQDKQFRMDRTYHHCLWYIRFVDNGILYTFTNCRISCLNLEINVNWTSVKHNSCFQLFVYL